MKYQLFISDFDGTLVRADGTVSEKVKRAIARYTAAGGIFTVCTGRMLSSILPRMKELGITTGYVAAYQGAVIAETATGNIVKFEGFGQADALRVVQMLEAEDRHIHVYTEEGLFCNRRDEWLGVYEKICGVKGEVPEERLSDWLMKKPRRVVKVLTVEPPDTCDAVQTRFARRLGEKYFVTRSSDWLIEFLPAGQNKGAAVEFLKEKFGVPYERTAAIGDMLNDIALLEHAGGKFAVANAAEELKKTATVVASCEEDGVAEAIEIALRGE